MKHEDWQAKEENQGKRETKKKIEKLIKKEMSICIYKKKTQTNNNANNVY